MAERCVQLVLHYDGTAFAGWQLQPGLRTVQGVLEETLGRLHGAPIRVTGAGRTDAGVHARGQAASITVAPHWEPPRLRRVMNQQLPADLWVASAHEMRPGFHARFSAVARRYRYRLGTRPDAGSPFRRRWATPYEGAPLDRETLDWCAATNSIVLRTWSAHAETPAILWIAASRLVTSTAWFMTDILASCGSCDWDRQVGVRTWAAGTPAAPTGRSKKPTVRVPHRRKNGQ